MSGGRFDYKQYSIEGMVREIEEFLNSEEKNQYSEKVIEKIKEGLLILKQAFVVAHRIDYLLEGDDGEESFLQRLEEDLGELNVK